MTARTYLYDGALAGPPSSTIDWAKRARRDHGEPLILANGPNWADCVCGLCGGMIVPGGFGPGGGISNLRGELLSQGRIGIFSLDQMAVIHECPLPGTTPMEIITAAAVAAFNHRHH